MLPSDAPRRWVSPSLQVKWGPYFKPDPAEELQVVQMAQAALGGAPGTKPLVTRRHALEKVAPLFGIENVDAVLDELEKAETDAGDLAHQRDMDLQHALAKTMNDGGEPGPGAARRTPTGQGTEPQTD